MLEEIYVLDLEMNVILGNTTNITIPITFLDTNKVICTLKIDSVYLAALCCKENEVFVLNSLRKIKKSLPKNLSPSIIRRNYFKFLEIFERQKIKFDYKEDTKIVAVGLFKDTINLMENEIFLDIIESYNCVTTTDLDILSCKVDGSVSCKSYLKKPLDLKASFNVSNDLKVFSDQEYQRNGTECLFDLRLYGGIIQVFRYMIQEKRPPLLIKKLKDGYEIIANSKLKEVSLIIPLQPSTYKTNCSITTGKVKEISGKLIWEIPVLEFNGAKIFLKPLFLEKEEISKNILISFKGNFNNNIKIEGLRSGEKKINSYAKFEILSNNYEVRINEN